jgi:hypothetical protein
MLFDLRGRGRRRTVKLVYVLLAFLMGGGLIFFGIGSSVNGGIVDAITQGGGGGNTDKTFQKRVDQASLAVRARPQDPAAWAAMARARYQLASTGDNLDRATGQYSSAGRAELQKAADAWQKHLQTAGDKPDDSLASLMVRTYASLGQPANAVAAQEIITEARPKSATYSTLAVLAYEAGQTRKGDLAGKKALELTDKDLRPTLKSQLDQAKAQSAAQAAQTATPTPTPQAKKK